MWMNWEKAGDDAHFPDSSGETSCKFSFGGEQASKIHPIKVDHHIRELANENKRLWLELKEKNDMMIGLRDEIYFKQRQLEDLEKYRDEVEQFKNDDQYADLIREIHQLKADLREKQILIKFLNEMVENLCDEVLQNEHIECMEIEIETLENENRKLTKENSEIKVKLKILEHDNEKMHSKFDHYEEDNRNMKKKLEKTTKKLKEKENSMLSFKKFTELANNLQNRIARSKSENLALRNVIERMKHVGDNYETLEGENLKLKEIIHDLEISTNQLKERIRILQESQLRMNENETVTKPELQRENTLLHNRLKEYEKELELLMEKNSKLKANLKVYEKILIENKSYIERVESRLEAIDRLDKENSKLKENIDRANETLNRELTEKYRVVSDNSRLQKDRTELLNKVKELEMNNGNLSNQLSDLRRERVEAEEETNDLKRQLQVYKNTVDNQDTTLKIRAEEMESLRRENLDLRAHIKQYENQIQIAGKVYKLVT